MWYTFMNKRFSNYCDFSHIIFEIRIKILDVRPGGTVGTTGTSPGDFWDVDNFHKLSVEKKILKIGQKLTELEIDTKLCFKIFQAD